MFLPLPSGRVPDLPQPAAGPLGGGGFGAAALPGVPGLGQRLRASTFGRKRKACLELCPWVKIQISHVCFPAGLV